MVEHKTTTAEEKRLKIPTAESMVGGARVELAIQQPKVEPEHWRPKRSRGDGTVGPGGQGRAIKTSIRGKARALVEADFKAKLSDQYKILPKKLIHLLMETNVLMLFPSKGA